MPTKIFQSNKIASLIFSDFSAVVVAQHRGKPAIFATFGYNG